MISLIENISVLLFGDKSFFQFERPEMLVLMLLIPLLIGIVFARKMVLVRKQKVQLDQSVQRRLFGKLTMTNFWRRFALGQLIVFLLIIGLANPQFGTLEQELEQKGVDLVFALDVSKSMMAEDIQPNRLERAKHEIAKVISKLGADRIAIVVFAGNAYLQLPLTSDHAAAKMYLDEIGVDLIPVGGTSLSKALQASLRALPEDSKGGTIVLISDGEGHDEDISEEIEACVEQEVKVYGIGLGTPEGTTVPKMVRGAKKGVLKDRSGAIVVSKLDEQLLKQVADETKGRYLRASNINVGVEEIVQELREGEQRDFGVKKYKQHESRFREVVLFAVVLLLLFIVLPNYRWS